MGKLNTAIVAIGNNTNPPGSQTSLTVEIREIQGAEYFP